MRSAISKADGLHSLDLQRDALEAVAVDAVNVCHDLASGRRDDRPGSTVCQRADVDEAAVLETLQRDAVRWLRGRADRTRTRPAGETAARALAVPTRQRRALLTSRRDA